MISLISGAAGQDGIILSRKLIQQGNTVVGLCRPEQKDFLAESVPGIESVAINLTEKSLLYELLDLWQPNEIYNLAAFSSVRKSWNEPDVSTLINCALPALFLDWITKYSLRTKFPQASSSEIFGGSTFGPQTEMSDLAPITPYGLTKAYAHQLVGMYREEYGLFASNAILYNHESPIRKTEYVTRHVSKSVAEISLGFRHSLEIGNLSATRDWGWAPDYVAGMILLARTDTPGDYVFATGEQHSVAELVKAAFTSLGIYDFERYIRNSESHVRKVDPGNLFGDSSKAAQELGWKKTINFNGIVETMVQSDLRSLQTGGAYKWLTDSKIWS